MAVRPSSINNRERDMLLENRAASRQAMKERLEAARVLEAPPGRHWYAAWIQGRDATVAAFEAAKDDAARAKVRELPAPSVTACADCFRKGRDAVIRVIEGG